MKKLILFSSLLLIAIAGEAQNAIKISRSGKGTPVILLPGFACPASVWDSTVINLKGNYEFHSVDYAGFNSLPPIGFPWYDSIRMALLDYIKQLRSKKIILIGHSMGGTLALEAAAAYPHKIKKLITVDGIPCIREIVMPGVKASQLSYNSSYNSKHLSLGENDFRKSVAFMANGMTNRKDKRDTLIKWMVEADRKTYIYGYTDLLKTDARPLLSKIKARVLIIAGSFPTEKAVQTNLHQQFELLPSKSIHIIPNTKHFVFWDDPQTFYELVNEFLHTKKEGK
jgi:pimeloyl-ACP methyl ester carboxylesterase